VLCIFVVDNADPCKSIHVTLLVKFRILLQSLVSKSAELSEADKALFLGQNALRFYGFKNLPELPYIKNMSE
jgi:hypothetical protein